MVVNRSALVPRTQRKKLKLNPSYGYGAMSNNVRKCTKCARMRAFSFVNFAYFCEKHPISFEDITYSQIFIFHTALTPMSTV